MVNQEIILVVEHLKMWLKVGGKHLRVVDDVSFTLRKGKTLAILGESGCGKTMLALSLLQLQPRNGYFSKTSHIFYQRKNLLECSDVQMQAIRGKKIAMIFQEPMTSLNPVLTIYQQITEAIYHSNPKLSKKALQHRMIKLLGEVKLPDPHYYSQLYPHQLSGGMKQRVMIAIALASNPDILIADEPTTALDVTTQMQILELLIQLQQVHQMSIILITHDLGIVQEISDTVAVMYAGEFVEQAATDDYFKQPVHPYSRQLLETLPTLSNRTNRLTSISGIVPTLDQPFPLCRFKERCLYKTACCENTKPELVRTNNAHYSRCLQTMEYLNARKIELKQQVKNEAIPHLKIKDESILDIKNLIVTYAKHNRLFIKSKEMITAVNDLTMLIKEGQTLALVGESGCGKTTVAKSILKLLSTYQGKISLYDTNIKDISNREQYSNTVQVIFQDPFSSLDPKKMVQEILLEGILARKNDFTLIFKCGIASFFTCCFNSIFLAFKYSIVCKHLE